MVDTKRLMSQFNNQYVDVEVLSIPAGSTYPKSVMVRVLTSDGPAQAARWGGLPIIEVGSKVVARRDANDYDSLIIGDLAGVDGLDELAQDAVGSILADSATVDFTYTDATPEITADVIPGGVDHDGLLNFEANEHVDHTAVTLTAGDGLTGGGDISSSRTLDVNVDDATIEIDTDTLQVKADGINDTHIDWGVGANQVSGVDMPILDAGGYYGTDNVEAALAEIGDGTVGPFVLRAGDTMEGDLDFDDTYDIVGAVDGEFLGDVTVAGDVGIGTTGPDTLLHLAKTNGTAIIRLERNDPTIIAGDVYGAIEFEGQDLSGNPLARGVRAKIQAIGEGPFGETGLQFMTAPLTSSFSERVRIDNAGNVGIGTTNPGAKLEVAGSQIISDDLTVGGTLYTDTVAEDTADAGVTVEGVEFLDGNANILGQNELRFYEGVNYVGFEAPALSADQIWVLPDADGDNGNVLSTNGSGALSWASGASISTTTRIDDGDSPYTILATNHVIFCDTDGGAITANLPAGVEGTHYKIINCGSSGNDLTVDPNGTEELYGAGAGISSTLSDGEVINIHYNATEGWW